MKHRWTFLACLTGALLLGVPGVARADAIEEIEELLTERWFEVEVIVFERLNVLDINSSEQLTQQQPRQWPHNLLQMQDATSIEINATAAALDLRADNPYCIGYPELLEAEPLHPSFLPRQLPPAPDDAEMARRAAESAAESAVAAADLILDDANAAPIDSAIEGTTSESTPALPPVTLETTQLTLTPYLQFLADVASFETSLFASSYTWLPDLAMQDYVKAINRQSHLRPVLHRRWRAPVPARDAPQPIYIASTVDEQAPATRPGFAKIEGHVSVTVGRFLHFAPTLWYHADNLGFAPIALPALQALPRPQPARYFEMAQSRRMRSEELHYLDHPKFGIVVRIDPVTIPAELIAQWEALDAQALQ